VERLKQQGEKSMIEKREKTMLELSKLKRRVDEFNYYGELEMMTQYVSDVRLVQKRVNEVQESIAWINNEELLYKYPPTQFPELEEINTGLDPFARLFQAVVKWQRAEKR
jgi:dynein heavy chain, axonemal